MLKTKKQHLGALNVQQMRRIPAQEAPTPLPSSPCKQETPLNSVQLSSSPSSSTGDFALPLQHDAHRDEATGEMSGTSLSPRHQARANTKLPWSPQHLDSDDDSWVEVRKQRVFIIIPPLPEPKSKSLRLKLAQSSKENAQCASKRSRAVLSEGRACNKGPSSKVIRKKTWKHAANSLKAEENDTRRHVKENISRGAPPISSMDILLASALGTDNTPWKAKQGHQIDLLASCTREEASLDTADSSIQPKCLKVRRMKPVIGSKRASKMPANSKRARKHIGPEQPISKPGDSSLRDRHCLGESPILSPSKAIRVTTLKKHLEKAGGLKSWLCSLGLGQFQEAFGKQMWSEVDLVQLQMEDLKQMGKPAVGPRRKLIWAIHHFSRQII